MEKKIFLYLFVIGIWVMNLNDLIIGSWFYYSIKSIVFWNLFALGSFVLLLREFNKEKKYNGV
jgi:hypothetical protein